MPLPQPQPQRQCRTRLLQHLLRSRRPSQLRSPQRRQLQRSLLLSLLRRHHQLSHLVQVSCGPSTRPAHTGLTAHTEHKLITAEPAAAAAVEQELPASPRKPEPEEAVALTTGASAPAEPAAEGSEASPKKGGSTKKLGESGKGAGAPALEKKKSREKSSSPPKGRPGASKPADAAADKKPDKKPVGPPPLPKAGVVFKEGVSITPVPPQPETPYQQYLEAHRRYVEATTSAQ